MHKTEAPQRLCRVCGQVLPLDCFEQYPTGTHRHVCRQCKYQTYGKRAKQRWRRRQLMAVLRRDESQDVNP